MNLSIGHCFVLFCFCCRNWTVLQPSLASRRPKASHCRSASVAHLNRNQSLNCKCNLLPHFHVCAGIPLNRGLLNFRSSGIDLQVGARFEPQTLEGIIEGTLNQHESSERFRFSFLEGTRWRGGLEQNTSVTYDDQELLLYDGVTVASVDHVLKKLDCLLPVRVCVSDRFLLQLIARHQSDADVQHFMCSLSEETRRDAGVSLASANVCFC